ncbi:MAG: ferredoxin--NADP reductase, partial [Planctomycetota bacterium]|nr:ferredoxin--NADP reductase [Planctomycetota bacterium]
MKIHEPNAELVSRHDWTDGLATFAVRPLGWTFPNFAPGQFTNLALPEGEDWDAETGANLRRAYSIASVPGADTVEFFIRRVDDGALTPKLFDLPVGGKLFLEQRAAGHFTLAGATDSEDLILVGTGTGVAPYRPMLHDQSTRARFGRTIILYSDRHVRDLGYLEEFRAMEDEGFRFFPTITGDEPAEAWEGLRGRVNRFLEPETYEQLTGQPLTPERCQVFLCGNPQMVVDVQEMLSP